MREIKFRAWHPQPGHSDGASMLYVGDDFGTKHPLDCCRYAMDGQPVTLMQYTGLKDSNGKEIYEGDIVQWQGDLDVQAMTDMFGPNIDDWPEDGWIYKPPKKDVVSMARFPRYWLEKEEFGYEGEELVCPDVCEVIGNIYQNPELLGARP